jgi:hypothetical protein
MLYTCQSLTSLSFGFACSRKKEKKKSHISEASAKHTYMPRKNEFDLYHICTLALHEIFSSLKYIIPNYKTK